MNKPRKPFQYDEERSRRNLQRGTIQHVVRALTAYIKDGEPLDGSDSMMLRSVAARLAGETPKKLKRRQVRIPNVLRALKGYLAKDQPLKAADQLRLQLVAKQLAPVKPWRPKKTRTSGSIATGEGLAERRARKVRQQWLDENRGSQRYPRGRLDKLVADAILHTEKKFPKLKGRLSHHNVRMLLKRGKPQTPD